MKKFALVYLMSLISTFVIIFFTRYKYPIDIFSVTMFSVILTILFSIIYSLIYVIDKIYKR